MQRALTLGLGHELSIEGAVFGHEQGRCDPTRRRARCRRLELSLSCMKIRTARRIAAPAAKCRERHDAFLEAGVADPTEYVERANLA